MAGEAKTGIGIQIKKAPVGLAALALVGPSFVWAAEYIGAGEVVIATRTGAILGTTVLWAVVLGVFLKFWIGVSGARYTVCTGEGMMDMFSRIPGPRHWVVWLVLVAQIVCGVLAIGTLATMAGTFINGLLGFVDPKVGGWCAGFFALAVAWSGVFGVLKIVMSLFVLVVVLGAFYVAGHVMPGFGEFVAGFSLNLGEVPMWARSVEGVSSSAWDELLPVLGWGAGGFASQVWYTYWVIGAGYGATAGRGCGKAADTEALATMSRGTAEKIKGWCKVLYLDSGFAMVLGVLVTGAFLISGAGILGAAEIVPSNDKMAVTLATVFSARWEWVGGFLFKLCGAVAMISTMVGQLAGWPRLIADGCRICIPGFDKKFQWKTQFHIFLIFFFVSSMVVVFMLGQEPVFLLKISSILEGVLLTALQAFCVGMGLFYVLPRMLSKEAYAVLKPNPVFAVGLLATFLFFSYMCIFHIPGTLMKLFSGG